MLVTDSKVDQSQQRLPCDVGHFFPIASPCSRSLVLCDKRGPNGVSFNWKSYLPLTTCPHGAGRFRAQKLEDSVPCVRERSKRNELRRSVISFGGETQPGSSQLTFIGKALYSTDHLRLLDQYPNLAPRLARSRSTYSLLSFGAEMPKHGTIGKGKVGVFFSKEEDQTHTSSWPYYHS